MGLKCVYFFQHCFATTFALKSPQIKNVQILYYLIDCYVSMFFLSQQNIKNIVQVNDKMHTFIRSPE